MSRTPGDTRVAAASLSARRLASRGRLHIERVLLLALGFGVFTFAGGAWSTAAQAAGVTVSGQPVPTQLPTNPVEPSQLPDNPVGPSQVPANPVQPSQLPSNPVQPSQLPVNPVEPSQLPTNPVQPSQLPTNPVQPVQPIYDPSFPAQVPVYPVQPDSPVQVNTPPPAQVTQPIYIPGEPSVLLVPSTTTTMVGLPMTFTYSAVPTSTSTPIQSVVIAFGDGVVLPGSTAGGTVTHSYSAQGSYEPVVAAVDSSGQSGQDSTSVVVVPSNTAQPPVNVIAPVQPVYVVTGFEPNVDLVASTTTAQVGQTVTFSYAAIPYSAPIQTVLITFGDGVALPAPAPTGAVTHAYSAQGTYQALVTATDTTGQYGQDVATTSVVPATTTQPQASVPLVSMTYLAGWNLVAAPTGTAITGATPPLYTWQTGDTAYVPSQTTTSGYGHWAYFAAPSAVGMPVTAPSTITKSLQPNVYVMIGNSGTTSATVTGADVVYVYNPSTGYQATNVLLPGQGAWVLSSTGGNMTIASNPV